MQAPDDARVGQLALAHQLISESELEHCRHLQQAGDERALLVLMVETGVLTAAQAQRLSSLAHEEVADATPPAAPRHVPIAVRPISSDDHDAPLAPPLVVPLEDEENGVEGYDDSSLYNLADSRPLPVMPVEEEEETKDELPPEAVNEPLLPLDLRLAPDNDERFPGEDTETGEPDFEEESSAGDDTVVRELRVMMSEAAGEDQLIGHSFAGCELVERLGTGGMGAVYKARHQLLDKYVAIKILSPGASDSVDSIERFLREARSAAQLDHPNVVRIFDVGEAHEHYFISMEYVEGQDLEQWFQAHEGRPISVADTIYVAKEVCKALIMAHERGIVHRDIKPGNVMLSGARVKVTDFGLAKVEDPGMPDNSGLTVSGEVLGSPYFMAPEQASAEPVDARTDLYSLGATLYYLLTGQHAYTGDNPLAIMMKHSSEPLAPPRSLRADLPEEVDRLIQVLMSKRKEKRPENARELLASLESFAFFENSPLEELGMAAYVPPAPEPGQAAETTRGAQRIKLPGASERSRPHTAKLIVRKPVSSALPVVPLSQPQSDELSNEQKEKIAETLRTVRAMIEAGTLDQAAHAMQQALATLPAHDDLLSLQREVDTARARQLASSVKEHLHAKQIGAASDALEEASQLAPDLEVLETLRNQLRKLTAPLDEKVCSTQELFADGKLDAALAILNKVLEIYPGHDSAQELKRKWEMRKQVADNAVKRATEALRVRDLDKAESTLQTGLDSVPTHPQLAKLKATLEKMRGEQGKLVDKARQLVQKHRPSTAVQTLESAYSLPPEDEKAKRVYDQALAALKKHEQELAEAKAKDAEQDFRAAYAAYRRAIGHNKDCKPSAKRMGELGELVEQIEKRARKANKVADAGELQQAQKLWQAILDELAPGDKDIQSRMEAAAERSRKADRLLETGTKAQTRKDFAGAIKAYEQVLELGLNRSKAEEGLAKAKLALKRRRRRRRMLATATLSLLLLAGAAGVVVYVQTEEARQYDEARSLLAAAEPLVEPEEALTLIAEAKGHLEALQSAPWAEARDPLALTDLGVTSDQLDALAEEIERLNRLAQARTAENEQRWDDAASHYEALGEDAAWHLSRVEAQQIAALHRECLTELSALFRRWETDFALTLLLREPDSLAEAHALGERILETHRQAQEHATQFEHAVAARQEVTAEQSEQAQLQWPTLSSVSTPQRDFVETLASELVRLEEFASAYTAVEDWSWPSWRRRLSNRLEFDEAALARMIEQPLSIAEQSAWQEHYAEVLEPLRALQAALPLAAAHHEAWSRYEAGWQTLRQHNGPARAPLAEALEHWQQSATRMDALYVATESALNNADALQEDSAVRQFVVTLRSSAEPALAQLGAPLNPSAGSLIARLRAFVQLDARAPLWLAGEVPGEPYLVTFVRLDPVRQAAFSRFVDESYLDTSLWTEFLDEFSQMSLSFQQDHIRRSQSPPSLSDPEAAVQDVSWFQAMAYIRWLQAEQSNVVARLPRAAELIAWQQAGFELARNNAGETLAPWCGDTHEADGHGVIVRPDDEQQGAPTAEQVPRDTNDGTTLTLVYDLNVHPIEAPSFD